MTYESHCPSLLVLLISFLYSTVAAVKQRKPSLPRVQRGSELRERDERLKLWAERERGPPNHYFFVALVYKYLLHQLNQGCLASVGKGGRYAYALWECSSAWPFVSRQATKPIKNGQVTRVQIVNRITGITPPPVGNTSIRKMGKWGRVVRAHGFMQLLWILTFWCQY